MQADVEATVAAWSVYGGYAKEKEELIESKWAEIRLQLHRVDDFIGRWLKSAGSMDDSPMKLTLLRELGTYRRCGSLLNHHGLQQSPLPNFVPPSMWPG